MPTPAYKLECLLFLLDRMSVDWTVFMDEGVKRLPKTIVYTNNKLTARFLATVLLQKGYRCFAISADVSPQMRMKYVKKLRRGEIDMLLTTDVASRGLNIESVDVVINYDLPKAVNFSEYVGAFNSLLYCSRFIALGVAADEATLHAQSHSSTHSQTATLPSFWKRFWLWTCRIDCVYFRHSNRWTKLCPNFCNQRSNFNRLNICSD